MDKVEPYIKKIDDIIAQYPSLTQYGAFVVVMSDENGFVNCSPHHVVWIVKNDHDMYTEGNQCGLIAIFLYILQQYYLTLWCSSRDQWHSTEAGSCRSCSQRHLFRRRAPRVDFARNTNIWNHGHEALVAHKVSLLSFALNRMFILDSSLIETLKELEAKTGQPKALFFVLFSLIIFGLIFAIGGFKLFSDLVGFIYPAYMSFKSLEGGKNVDGDASQWMTYWIVFCFVTMIESALPFLIQYVKFYYLIKCAVIIWLFHPKTSGAQVIYSSAVRPYILPLMSGSTIKPVVEGEKEPEAKKAE
jgi:receptor expression-enhancing protein 5/6